MKPDLSKLVDILRYARLIREFVKGIEKSNFDQDEKTQFAVTRCIEIIGEASKGIPDEFKAAHAEIPWRRMAGMRDILIHYYAEVDTDEVWNVSQNDIPVLIAQIEPLIPPEE
jgi:uncharacterized protein with HEPN domain